MPEEPFASGKFDRSNKELYYRCHAVIERELHALTSVNQAASYLKEKFSSDCLDKQIDLLSRMRTENPTEAIGKAKELIESCCKTILEEQGVSVDKGLGCVTPDKRDGEASQDSGKGCRRHDASRENREETFWKLAWRCR